MKKVLLFSFLVLGVAFRLESADPAPQSVKITIKTISASKKGAEFDSRLASLEKQLRALNYRSYRLLNDETQSARWQGKAVFTIPGGRTLTVRPQDMINNQLGLKVLLRRGDKPQLETIVRLMDGGNFILGGPAYEGGVLVLLISASLQ